MNIPGLHDLESAIYIYVGQKTNAAGMLCPWYVLKETEGGELKEVALKERGFTGLIEKLEIKQVEVKAGKNQEIKEKLDLHFFAQKPDGSRQKVIIRCGVDTVFYKGIVLKLAALDPTLFTQPFTVTATVADENNKVVFAGLIAQDQSIRAEWDTEANFKELIEVINSQIRGYKAEAEAQKEYFVHESEKEVEEIPF